MVRVVFVLSSLLLAACPPTTGAKPCTGNSDCNLFAGGACLPSPLGTDQCAYPDTACPSGLSWGELSTDIAGECVVPLDAGVDAQAEPAFGVVYASTWRFSVAGPVGSFTQIVNTSNQPLDLSTLVVTRLGDDHSTAVVRVTATPSSAVLSPGTAGGALSPLAQAAFVGLVSEPRDDVDSSYLSIELLNAPEGTYDIHVDLQIGLDGRELALPMTLHVVPGPTVFADPESGNRLRVYR